MKRRFLPLLLGIFALGGAAEARAQTAKASDPAAAEALYKSGRELLDQGDWAGACQKFEASMALNTAVSTLLNLAKCSEHEGRLSDALAAYKRALQLNRDTLGDERREALERVANEGIQAISPRLSRLSITVDAPPAGLSLTRDGLAILEGAMGESVPVDPGEHVVIAKAPGYAETTQNVTLREGESRQILVRLAPLPSGDAPLGAPPLSEGSDDPAWPWVTGGVGLALIGAAIAFRVDQAAAEGALTDHCGEQLVCDPTGGYDPEGDNARKNLDFGLFVGLGAAGLLGVGAAVIGLASGGEAPSKTATRLLPLASPGAFGLGLRGAL